MNKPVKKRKYERMPPDDDVDIWMVRRQKPCFVYKEIYIHFMQPALMNRKITIDRLRQDLNNDL
jgi:hypothetical protein